MNADFFAKVRQAYAEHPLSAATILDRIRRHKGSLDQLTEMDLAVDDETRVTDQNHTGGVEAVKAIARAVGLQGGDRVLDVGTGLGGTPRLLAHLYSCHCHGIELTETRFRDAITLTQLVKLEEQVTFTHGDFLAIEVPGGPFNVVIGQGAFMHFADHGRLMHKCADLLKPGGWLAVEDGYLRRNPAGEEESRHLKALLDCWNGQFYSLPCWAEWLDTAGLVRQQTDDLSELARQELRQRAQLADEGKLVSVRESELSGWRLGAELIATGVIGIMRLLAQKPPIITQRDATLKIRT